eukprot:SAG31_NODE_16371_length_711_cov_3.318627_1_plen_40_part_01
MYRFSFGPGRSTAVLMVISTAVCQLETAVLVNFKTGAAVR